MDKLFLDKRDGSEMAVWGAQLSFNQFHKLQSILQRAGGCTTTNVIYNQNISTDDRLPLMPHLKWTELKRLQVRLFHFFKINTPVQLFWKFDSAFSSLQCNVEKVLHVVNQFSWSLTFIMKGKDQECDFTVWRMP